MKYSTAVKWAVLVLLPLTFGWKLWIASRPVDAAEIRYSVAAFLARHHFRVDLDNMTFSGLPVVITASAEQCRVLAVETTPLGDPVDPFKYLGADTDRTFVVYRGIAYDREPWFLTAGNYVWYSLLCRLGLASHIPRVLAVISSCDAAGLPWSELDFI